MTIVSLAAGVALLIAFVFTEKRVDQPLLPLHIVWDRARGGAYASIAIAGASVFAIFLFLTFFMQQNLGYSPLKTGVAFLPLTVLIFIMAPTVQTQVLPRLGARPIIMTGMALGAVAMLAFFAQLTPSSTYVSHVLPACSSWASGCRASSRRRLGPRRSVSTATRPASRRRWSTPPSRWAARSAPRCSRRSSPPPRRATPPATRAARSWPRPPWCTAIRRRSTAPRSCSRSDSSSLPSCSSPHRAATAARRRTGDGDGLGALAKALHVRGLRRFRSRAERLDVEKL